MSGEASSRKFVFGICIILLSLLARDLRKKYDCSQSIFHCLRSLLVYFFYLRVIVIYVSFLDFLKRNTCSICPLAFPVGFLGFELLGLHDLFIDSLLCIGQFQARSSPPRATPGHLTPVRLHIVGHLTRIETRPIGHLTRRKNVGQRSRLKMICIPCKPFNTTIEKRSNKYI